MFSYITSHLGLQFLYPGQILTSAVEYDRFNIIDSQLESLFKIFGNINNGWEIISESEYNNLSINKEQDDIETYVFSNSDEEYTNKYVYLTVGNGIINNIGCETKYYHKIELISTSDSNYIYLTTNEQTPLTRDPVVFVSTEDNLTTLDGNIVYIKLAKCTVNKTDNSIEIIAEPNQADVSRLINDLVKHIHGKDGVAKIDLSEEVLGTLSADNITDIDASRINTGVINPAIVELSHLLLKDIGTLTHSEIDSAITFLQNSNKKLFGELTTSNFLQVYIALKKEKQNIDRYFRNLISIIPGYGNIGYAYNIGEDIYDCVGNTFLDIFSYIPSDDESKDGTYKDLSTNKISNPAIVDFWGYEIRGYGASSFFTSTVSIDTKVEFEETAYEPDFIEIVGIDMYQYGYGYGYGLGLNYFDISQDYSDLFGLSSDVFGLRIGYFSDNTLNTTAAYAYGFGYEYFQGDDFEVNKVIVRLKDPKTVFELYNILSETENKNKIGFWNPKDDNYILYDESSGLIIDKEDDNNSLDKFRIHVINDIQAGDAVTYNPILRYRNEDTSSLEKAYIDDFNSFFIQFDHSRIGMNTEDSTWFAETYGEGSAFTYGYEYSVDFVLEKSGEELTLSGHAIDPLFESCVKGDLDYDATFWWGYLPGFGYHNGTVNNPIERLEFSLDATYMTAVRGYLNNSGYSIKYIDIKPKVKCSILSRDLNSSEDEIYTDDLVYKKYFDSSNSIDNISGSLFGTVSLPMAWGYTVDKIGFIKSFEYLDDEINNTISEIYFTFASTVKINSFSWIANEPSDSKIILKFRGSTVSTEDLVNCEYDDFPSYCNKDITIYSSGDIISQVIEVKCIEVNVILKPSTDKTVSPELNSITLSYTMNGIISSVVISGEDFQTNWQSTSERKNVKIYLENDNSYYIGIKNFNNVNRIFIGSEGYVTVYKKDTVGTYEFKEESKKLITAEKSIHQTLMNLSDECGMVYSCRYLDNGDLVVLDPENQRVLILDGQLFEFKKGIYGSTGFTSKDQSSTFEVVDSFINEQEKSIYLVFSHMLDSTPINCRFAIKSFEETYTIIIEPENYSTSLICDFNSLITDDIRCVRIPSSYYVYNELADGTLENITASGKYGFENISNLSNILFIKLTDSQFEQIQSLGEDITISFRLYSTNGTDPKTYNIPVALKEVENFNVPENVSKALGKKSIYYRPIVNPISVDVLHNGYISLCNVIPSKGDEDLYYFNLNNYGKVNHISASSSEFNSIQIYDINSDTLDFIQVNPDFNNVLFSFATYGSFKEIKVGLNTYRYLLSNSLGKEIRVYDDYRSDVLNIDEDPLSYKLNVLLEDLYTDAKVESKFDYYVSCFNGMDTYYYVSLLGVIASSYVSDHKLIKFNSDFSEYEIFLDNQVVDPSAININNPINTDTKDGRLIITV